MLCFRVWVVLAVLHLGAWQVESSVITIPVFPDGKDQCVLTLDNDHGPGWGPHDAMVAFSNRYDIAYNKLSHSLWRATPPQLFAVITLLCLVYRTGTQQHPPRYSWSIALTRRSPIAWSRRCGCETWIPRECRRCCV